jgi:hypothetical protein
MLPSMGSSYGKKDITLSIRKQASIERSGISLAYSKFARENSKLVRES